MGEERAQVCSWPRGLSAGAQAAPDSDLPSFRWVGEGAGPGVAAAPRLPPLELQPAKAPPVSGSWGCRAPLPQGFPILQIKIQGTQLNFSFTLQ